MQCTLIRARVQVIGRVTEPCEPRIFWLHIKKSGGTFTRKALTDLGLHMQVDRTRRPANFLRVSKFECNDVLNNYRFVQGQR